jgi:type II secretory pathway pseudopilin PulG
VNLRGMSTIEALVSLAIVGIVSSYLLPLVSFSSKTAGETMKLDILKRTVELNLFEMKSRPFLDLPAADSCLIRAYDINGKLTQEYSTTASDPSCGKSRTGGYQISIRVTRPDITSFTFNPAQFLKMPTQADNIRQVQLIGCPESKDVSNECGMGRFKVTVIRR